MKFNEQGAFMKLGLFVISPDQVQNSRLKELALRAYSNMVVSTTAALAHIQIDAFLTHSPIHLIAKEMCYSNTLVHTREALWIFTNVLCCGSFEQIQTLW